MAVLSVLQISIRFLLFIVFRKTPELSGEVLSEDGLSKYLSNTQLKSLLIINLVQEMSRIRSSTFGNNCGLSELGPYID